ncbi:hypothetical protein PR048_003485 [Dryococelus australis]|uniref:Uncharacterized protein n=1 Tax=Dryococelus australis TaxID=614101 RepID=A0ABQ9IN66_9NEOP|nr:hypothetical protein PR048_003485 [Dryococelus australis]
MKEETNPTQPSQKSGAVLHRQLLYLNLKRDGLLGDGLWCCVEQWDSYRLFTVYLKSARFIVNKLYPAVDAWSRPTLPGRLPICRVAGRVAFLASVGVPSPSPSGWPAVSNPRHGASPPLIHSSRRLSPLANQLQTEHKRKTLCLRCESVGVGNSKARRVHKPVEKARVDHGRSSHRATGFKDSTGRRCTPYRNMSRQLGLRMRTPVSYPERDLSSRRPLPLRPEHRQECVTSCQEVATFGLPTSWFSNDSRFCLDTDDRRIRVWSQPRGPRGAPPQRNVSWFLGAISYDSRIPLVAIEGTLTAQRYVQGILRACALPFLVQHDNRILHQGNARLQTARVSLACFQYHNMLPWPARSLDLSPIGNISEQIGRPLRSAATTADLVGQLCHLWQHFPQDIRHMYASMPDQIAASLRAAVAEWLACSPPTKAIRVQSTAGSQNFCMWESCRRVFSGISLFPALSFRRRSILISITLIGSQYHAIYWPCVFRWQTDNTRNKSGDAGHVAVEAISDRLAEVTSLAEQLDAVLCGLQRAEAPNHAAPDMKRILDGTASTAPELRQNARAGETGDPRVNPSNGGVSRHDSRVRKSERAIPRRESNPVPHDIQYSVCGIYNSVSRCVAAIVLRPWLLPLNSLPRVSNVDTSATQLQVACGRLSSAWHDAILLYLAGTSAGLVLFPLPSCRQRASWYQLGFPLVDDRPIMNAVKYRVVSGVVWTDRTMVSSNTELNRTGVLAVVDIGRPISLAADHPPISVSQHRTAFLPTRLAKMAWIEFEVVVRKTPQNSHVSEDCLSATLVGDEREGSRSYWLAAKSTR